MKAEMSKKAAVIIAVVMSLLLMASGIITAYAGSGKTALLNGDGPADLPENTEQAVTLYSNAIIKYGPDGYDLSGYPDLIRRFGGLTGTMEGGTAALYMLDLMYDKDNLGLSMVPASIDEIVYKLQVLNDTVDHRISDLKEATAGIPAEAERLDQAQTNLNGWKDDLKKNTDKFNAANGKYKSLVLQNLQKWWSEARDPESGGVSVLYTKDQAKFLLTYSGQPYQSGVFPDTADNGETVDKDMSFSVPAACLEFTKDVDFKAESFRGDFVYYAKDKLLKAANDKTLTASDAFYQDWNNLDDSAKPDRAIVLADDLLNTIIYQCSLNVVKENKDNWVKTLVSDYGSYCYELDKFESTLEDLIEAEFITHGFEGEIKDDIVDLLERVTAISGFYGMTALAAGTQSAEFTDDDKLELQKSWIDNITWLNTEKKCSLTGHDNYCYPVGKLLEFNEMQVTTTAQAQYECDDEEERFAYYDGYTPDNWKLCDKDGNEADVPAILNGDDMRVLQRLFMEQMSGDETYAEYLHKNGVDIPENFMDKLMTEYHGASRFNLDDDIWMIATVLYGDYFKTGKWYQIIKPDTTLGRYWFFSHDQVRYSYIDTKEAGGADCFDTGILAARAGYFEHHFYWSIDEGTMLDQNAGVTLKENKESIALFDPDRGRYIPGYKATTDINQKAPVYMLTLKDAPLSEAGPLANTVGYVRPLIVKESEHAPAAPADWEKAEAMLNLYPENDAEHEKKLDAGINTEINAAVYRAKEDGLKVELSAAEKKKIAKAVKETLMSCQEELKGSGTLAYQDALGLEGDDAAEIALAKEVLPGTHLDEKGEPLASADDMSVMALYEPHATLKFVSENGAVKALIEPAFNIDPTLVVWDSAVGEYDSFEIPDDYMTAQGLTMTLRVPAKSAADATSVTVNHYSDDRDNVASYDTVLNTDTVDTYAEVKAAVSGTFELKLGQKTIKITKKPHPKKTSIKSLKKVKKGIKATWKKVSTVTGYQLQYSAKKNFSSKKTVNIKKKSVTSKTIKGLKKGKKYYFRIRTYKTKDGEKYYSGWSKTRSKKYKK